MKFYAIATGRRETSGHGESVVATSIEIGDDFYTPHRVPQLYASEEEAERQIRPSDRFDQSQPWKSFKTVVPLELKDQ